MRIVGLVVLALIAYFVWRFVVRGDALVVITRDSGKKVTGAVTRVVPGKELVVEVRQSLEGDPHHGAIARPDAGRRARDLRAGGIQGGGAAAHRPGTRGPGVPDASGFIHFRYEAKWGIGGSISSFRTRLGSPEPERAPQPPSSPGGRPAG